MELLKKYNFVDIYIFGKADNGEYISLTDWYLCKENATLKFDTDSQFLVGFSTYQNREYYVADISIDELIELAGLNPNTHFVSQMLNGVDDEQSNNLLAIYCSQKIVNYNNGRCCLVDNNTYAFKRRKNIGNGKRTMEVVLAKELHKLYA